MEVDYYDFIIKGEFGNFKFGTPWSDVITLLGDPPLHAPADEFTSQIARYGDLELIISDEKKILVISIQLDRDYIEIPKNLMLKNFETPALELEFVFELLKKNNISWKRMEVMCDDRIDYYFTSTGVHLSFADNKLGKVGAANPNSKWGE